MNDEIDPIFVGEVDDIDIGSVENFEHEDYNYAIYRLDSGYFATQGNCNCEERALLSESSLESEEIECVSCGKIYSIVSGDCISNPELNGLKTYDIFQEDGTLYLNL